MMSYWEYDVYLRRRNDVHVRQLSLTIIGLCRGLSTDCSLKGPCLNYFSSISSSLFLWMGWPPATTVQFSHAILSSIHYWPRQLKAICHGYDEVIIIVACAGIRVLCVRYAICGLLSTDVLFIYTVLFTSLSQVEVDTELSYELCRVW